MTIDKTFDFAGIEAKWAKHWEESGAYRPHRPEAEPYTIVNPPPNVTGSLHIGHALDNTLQDILIRHARLKGKDALWVVGTDHAGIATQMVVERQLEAPRHAVERLFRGLSSGDVGIGADDAHRLAAVAGAAGLLRRSREEAADGVGCVAHRVAAVEVGERARSGVNSRSGGRGGHPINRRADDGPQARALRQRHPNVHWLGVLPRQELAQVYAAADVFVFPCRNETFGQVMLEAMACGVPVAAYPVAGPLQVLGEAGAGAMRDDLREAWFEALKVKRHAARARAQQFSWGRATTLFASFLVLFPPRQRKPRPSPLNAAAAVRSLPGMEAVRLSHKRHPAVE